MSDAKHTPGPWELQDHRKGVECWTIAAADRCYVVAELECDHDEAEGNARLMAASPDLLAVLKSLVERAVLVPCKDGGSDAVHGEPGSMVAGKWRIESSVDGIIAEARAAITKAEGR